MITRFNEILRLYKESTVVIQSESDVSNYIITWAFPMMDK
jgi:hypothetical protein